MRDREIREAFKRYYESATIYQYTPTTSGSDNVLRWIDYDTWKYQVKCTNYMDPYNWKIGPQLNSNTRII